MLALKLNHVGKRGHWSPLWIHNNILLLTMKLLRDILVSICLFVHLYTSRSAFLPVCPSHMLCPLCNTYKVIQPWHGNKTAKYGTSCHVYSKACIVLYRFLLFLAQMITGMKGCVNRSKVKVTQRSFNFLWSGGGILVDHWSTVSSFLPLLATGMDGAGHWNSLLWNTKT